MKRITCGLFINILLSTGFLALGSLLKGDIAMSVLVGITGSLWLLAAWRDWKWYASLGLIIYMVVAVYSIISGYSPLFSLVSVVTALVAWDLFDFYWRVKRSVHVKNLGDIAPIHLRRLTVISGIGLATGGVAMLMQFRIGFGIVVVLGLVAIVMTGWVISMLRNH
jgi:hypothetical protein